MTQKLAVELRQVASTTQSERVKKQYEMVLQSARKAANDGKYSTYVYESLLPGTIQSLQQEGFTVKDCSAMNETTVEISW